MELKYDNPNAALAPSGTSVTPQYGGNISQVVWQVRGRERQAYTLSYDSENRMTNAKYSDISYSGTVTGGRYDETLTYDIRGNIQTLQRYGLTSVAGAPSPTWGQIDNLTYNYGASGYNPKNQLQSVTDNSGNLTKGFKTVANGSTYSYDTNGNMTADPNKEITSIAYNHLNLPTTITFTNSRSISFMYDAGGNKLRKTVVQSGVTQYTQDYVGGIEYRTNSSNVITLESIFHAEGRITNINGTLKYEYALKDHLGNTRIMFCDKNGNGKIEANATQENSEITQENHFYPFGLNMEGTWCNTPSVSDNKYQYNGKEYNDDFGLNLNDYGARFYDPAIGKWNGFDPMAEAYQSMSPYHYAMNNPMRFIDPNGMYAASGTDSKNTSALATDGSLVGGSGSHTESNGQKGGLGSNTTEKQNRTKVSVGGEVVADHADDGSDDSTMPLPSFNTMKKNFPEYDMTPRTGDGYGRNKNSAKDNDPNTYTNYQLFKEIGGALESSALNGDNVDKAYEYTCATRVCHALNKSGSKITQGFSGKSGKYILGVLSLATYLGKPDVTVLGNAGTINGTNSQLSGQKGIIFFKIAYNDANGHFALWDGNTLIGGGNHGMGNFKEATQVSLWKLN